SADWILAVSGGDCSAALLNFSLLVASCAVSVVQVAGIDGWLTWRLSPVASVTPGGPAGVAVGFGAGDGVGVGLAVVGDGLGVGDVVGGGEAPQVTPLTENTVGLGLLPVNEPLNPMFVLPPAASAPFQLWLVTFTFSPDWTRSRSSRWTPAGRRGT
ncbi:MAG TPA: hypothetical protein VGF32_22275, partial [Streptosporangiaceae bacterium]